MEGKKSVGIRERVFIGIARLAERRSGLMLLAAILVTIIAGGLASQLKLTMHFKNLMPQDHPMVQEFNQIINDYSTASMIIIAAKGNEAELKSFADEIVPEIKAMEKYVRRVEYKLDREFFLKHGLMLQKADDLKNMKDIYKDLSLLPLITNLNDSFEKEYVQDEESISTKEKENNAVMLLDGIKYWLNTMKLYAADADSLKPEVAEKAADRFLIGEEYMISQDKDMLLIFAQPTFTMTDVEMVLEAENTIDGLIAKVSKKYPSIFAGTTGTIALMRDETAAASEDMYITSIIAFVLILALFIVSFRMWTAPILAGISLLMGTTWAAGFAFLTVGSLNMFTSMFSVVLLGLGIDFSIHIISVYNESRAGGKSIGESLQDSLLKSGSGIVTGAVTTACAFLTLTISKSAGMKEFGVVTGSGVLFCMLATILVLPSLLALRDKIMIKLRKEKHTTKSTSFAFLGRIAEAISRRPVSVLSGALIVTAVLLYFALSIKFDYNYLNMEPVGLTSIKLQDEMIKEFDITPDFALITASSVEEARRITDASKDLKMVGMVDSISNYMPSAEEQQERLPYLEKIRDDLMYNRRMTALTDENIEQLLEELQRIKDNVVELAQLAYLGGQDKVDSKCREIAGDVENPESKGMIDLLMDEINSSRSMSIRNLNMFQERYEPYFRQMALEMASTEPITLENLPERILNQYESKAGDKYLVSIYPKEQVWDLSFLQRFFDRMQEIDQRVTGFTLVFYVLIQIIARDGKIAAALTLLVIFILLYIDLRKLRYAALAMVPLIVGAIWMVGTMSLLGLKLTMVNVMGIPLILGIGIDDGVHILHRYRIEGAGNIRATFSSTGKAILLTSLTTMIAFGSLVMATYRGLGSLGIALFIGVGMCFLTTVIILPAFLGLMERRKGVNGMSKQTAILLLIVSGILATVGVAQSEELTAKEIIQKIDETEKVSSSEGILTQIITTSGGQKRTLEMKVYSKNKGEKQLMIYTKPKRVEGDKILMLDEGDDIWFYTPKTDRVRHLASHARKQKVQGSDFSYEDMAGGNIEEDYRYTLMGEEKIDGAKCYKFELIPTESGPHYSKLILWADKEKFITIQVDFYEDGELLKRMKNQEIKQIDGHWYGMKMVMTNLQEGGETLIETVEIKFDIELDDDIFTTKDLKRR